MMLSYFLFILMLAQLLFAQDAEQTAPLSSQVVPATSILQPALPTSNGAGNNNSIPVEFPNPEYIRLLGHSFYFYMAQRSGKLGSDFPISWRHDSALDDGQDQGVDLSGGYYDAGDYLKFTFPLAYTLSIVSWGAIENWQGYVLSKQTDQLRDMLKWGTDWLIKAHPDNNTLFVQVGDGKVDNEYWGPDTGIPKPRPSYKITTDKKGTDIAAATAAAFASTSMVFRQLNLNQDADLLLQHAKELFVFAEQEPFTLYTDSVPASKDYYASQSFADELVWAALWLARATNDPSYKQKASNYFDRFRLAGKNTPMDWSDATGGVYVLGAEVDQDTSIYRLEAERYLDAKVNQKDGKCSLKAEGLLWCGDASQSNSLQPPLNTAFLLITYANKVNPAKNSTYYPFAMSQWNYALGKNPMNTPYVVGVHKNSPVNPHHAGAHGGVGLKNINSPPVNEHILYGAVVGGPGSDGWFDDERTNYDQSETALDYNAPFQSLLAYQLQTTSEPPYYVYVTEPRPKRGGLPTWAIVVIVLVVLLLVVGCCWFWIYRKRDALRRYFANRKNSTKSHL
ncbi:uncharacterized protein VTP21DRAFT_4905 [Calcarisporiella thermophila]|uniref:uncharacterized protein n=1 Tax=Calcarisporiella thermophila TaxID=911321 RepID=UPI0037440C59